MFCGVKCYKTAYLLNEKQPSPQLLKLVQVKVLFLVQFMPEKFLPTIAW